VGCPGQLARTTTIPHGPLNILQAQWAGKTPRGWQACTERIELGTGARQTSRLTTELNPQVQTSNILEDW
jgi:hypothetical protein